MRIGVVIAVLAVIVGCGAGASSSATPSTDLQIRVWPEGQGNGEMQRWTLRCVPAAGTLPRPGAACVKLSEMRSPFAPLSKNLQCTQIYGGPQEAVISGTFRGDKIWVRLTVRDGCQIARAKKLAFLVPGMGAAGS
jgi:Subtilisin inhibitor-like